MGATFAGRILVIGCGSVARCTIPLLLHYTGIAPTRITVIDMIDSSRFIRDALQSGVSFRVDQLTRENLATRLAAYTTSGDLIIDLAWNIDCCEILQWCHDNGVMYINTSVEVWNPYEGAGTKPPQERTLYVRHMAIRDMVKHWNSRGPTAVLEHGANPGLVSHFVKVGLTDIAVRTLEDDPQDGRARMLRRALEDQDFARLSMLLEVRVIHVSERDTQITNMPKQVNEFVNTWSVEGFREEGIAPAELGWGTHERTLPFDAHLHRSGPKNQICLSRMGIKTWVRSWVPLGEITGMVVRHGEAFTLSDHLTVWENNEVLYRPTVHYAYCPSDSAVNSVHELEMRRYQLQEKQRILADDIVSGSDELGVLLMGHRYRSWWVGSVLDIHEARRIAPHQNATTVQVAASVIAAVDWMFDHPDRGVCVPDDLPQAPILSLARGFLGRFISEAVDWTPLPAAGSGEVPYERSHYDFGDPWQFQNFLVE